MYITKRQSTRLGKQSKKLFKSHKGTFVAQTALGFLLLASVPTNAADFGTQSINRSEQSYTILAQADTAAAVGDQTVSLEELQGTRVVNLQAVELGEVAEVLVNNKGMVEGVVITITDIATVEPKQVFVNAAEIEPTGEVVIWRTNMVQEDIEGLPDYEGGEVSDAVY